MSIQLKRGSTSSIDLDFVLLGGQPGAEQLSERSCLKIGNGTLPWSSLTYLKTPFDAITELLTTLQGYDITDGGVAKTSSTFNIKIPVLLLLLIIQQIQERYLVQMEQV